MCDNKSKIVNKLDKSKYAQIINLLLEKKVHVCKCIKHIYDIDEYYIRIELSKIKIFYHIYDDIKSYYKNICDKTKMTMICTFGFTDNSLLQTTYLY